jgi:uncharacterized membrane protein YhaH (DUF805 family)
MLAAIQHNLGRLANFSGRDTRSQFWPWAGCVVGGVALVWFVAAGSVMATAVSKMTAFAEAHPEQATVTSVGGSTSIEIEGYHPEFVPDFGVLFWILGGIVAVTVVLLAAAVARRLHDRGRSAFWGLAPLPFLAFGLTVMPMMMSEVVIGVGEPDMRLFFAIFLNNICYLAVLLTLIIQLSGAGQPEANRFGPPTA